MYKKMNQIFELLNTSNAEIARIGGIDPSLVSRYRSGKRQPSSSSQQFIDFCNAIASYAVENRLWNKLTSVCQIPEADSPANSVLMFLLPSDIYLEKQNIISMENFSQSPGSLGDKLKLLMEVLDVTNVMLAKSLNVDTSLISRMKSGERSPKNNSEIIVRMCHYFIKRIKALGVPNEKLKLFNIPVITSGQDDEAYKKSLSEWLLSTASSNPLDTVDFIVKKLNSNISMPDSLIPENHELILSMAVEKPEKKYYGKKGFGEALLHLLSKIVVSQKNHTIKVYSDQSLKWFLTASPVFLQNLNLITNRVVEKQTNFQVIHNTDREQKELLLGIEYWLTLYKTGLVEGYYCSVPYTPRFSHTLIVVPGVGAIYSSLVSGTESEGVFIFTDLPQEVSFLTDQYETLLQQCKPLVNVYNRRTINNYILLGNKTPCSNKSQRNFILSPSLHTMPTDLFRRMISRVDSLSSAERTQYIEYHHFLVKQFEKDLSQRRIIDYIHFPDPEAIKAGLVGVNMSDLFIRDTITYTLEEYAEHVTNLISLMTNKNYHIYPLETAPSNEMRVITCEPSCVTILYGSIALRIKHPNIYNCMNKYIELFSTGNEISSNSDNKVANLLKKYTK